MASGPTPSEFSAGGVVVRDGQVVVIVPRKRAADGRPVLGLPKGHLDPGETAEQAALREVREETGIEAELIEPLGQVRYWYQRKGRRVHKEVAFFLLAHVGGSVEDHDDEVDEARWMPLADAARALSHPGERTVVERAIARAQADR